MNKKGFGWLGAFIIVIILGSIFAWAYYKNISWSDVTGLFKKSVNSTIANETEIQECPTCEDFPDVDMMAYYFDNDTYKGLNVFMDNSKSYLHCGFTNLESKEYASRLLALKNIGVDVKVNFGIEDTMTSCEVTCVPKLSSQYGYLLGEGLHVSYSHLNFNFCVNERAVYLFSLLPNEVARQDYGLIIFNPSLREKYEQYFEQLAS